MADEAIPKSPEKVKDFFNVAAIKHLFSLHRDEANRFDVIEEVRSNVAFRGSNLWILILAVLICSVGLNMNSTAVIIGAMLISPLMGPIVGLGVGSGTYDMKLMRRSAKNLGIAVVFSIVASGIYFFITPLNDAQSELLARTSPTIWDVIIALFGGLAGIIANTRKEKTTVVPGVAIATALMPPLCTAGYGLGTLNPSFFFGALYLFFINTVFISFSAWLMVRFMRFPKFDFVDAKRERNTKRMVTAIVLLTAIPSCFYAYSLVNSTIFEKNAQGFITEEFKYPTTHVIDSKIVSTKGERSVEVWLLGEPLDKKEQDLLRAKMVNHACEDATLQIWQAGVDSNEVDMNTLGKELFENLYAESEGRVAEKEAKILALENSLKAIQEQVIPMNDIVKEAKAAYPTLSELTLNRNPLYSANTNKVDTGLVAVVRFSRSLDGAEQQNFSNWLKVRTKSDSVLVVVR